MNSELKTKDMIKQRQSVKTQTKQTITVSMIDEDLKNGINKEGMMEKYGIKKWEVDEMFKNPKLTGRRPSRKKELSFTFVDDIVEDIPGFEGTTKQLDDLTPPTIEDTNSDEPITNPNQVTIEDVIKEEEEGMTLPTIEDTMELVQEQQMEEGETSKDYGDEDGDDDFISDEPETEKEVEVEVEEEDEFDSFEL
jgi:hypothetical protein